MEAPSTISRMATSNGHGEDSPYFDGWKAYDRNPYNPNLKPSGIIQMGLAENQLSYDMIERWLKQHPEASICTSEGIPRFHEIANNQDYHGQPDFRKGIASFMEEIRGNAVKFESDRIVLATGATAASEALAFCLADPGEAFLVPSPYYPAFDRDLKWRTGVELVPVQCSSSNNFQLTMSVLEDAYLQAKFRNIKVKGVLITNPSNPLGTTMDAQNLRDLLRFTTEKNIHLVCDEIYGGSVFSSPSFVSIAEIVAADKIKTDSVHIIYSLSKDMGLPGFRVGVIYSYNEAVVTTARRMSSFSLVSSQTQHLLGAILNDREFVREYVKENKKRLQEMHNIFVTGLLKAGISCLKSNAGLFCWVDMRHLLEEPGLQGELRLWKIILHQIGLNVSPGSSFHCNEAGWFRICFANLDAGTLQLATSRLRNFTNKKGRPSASPMTEENK